MRTSPAHPDHVADAYAAVDAFSDLDPALLASLRSPADEDAIAAALETQLTVLAAQSRHTAPVTPLRRRATDEQRAA